MTATETTTCERCGRPAAFTDSVPDAMLTGTHPGECGYRTVGLCEVHGWERRGVATARLSPIDPARLAAVAVLSAAKANLAGLDLDAATEAMRRELDVAAVRGEM
jgi:hypothetical protein